ncbi:MAG: OmpA family protein [Lewinellaceae bacterium]|nr:OmpA family protein [Saprospiraceae bacterium]MCB9340929.1 OmpA family protein [Lewinellaceae bacterium]
MFPRLALLPIGLFIIWCFVCQRWYVCYIKQKCGTEQTEQPPVTPPVDNRPLVFKWSEAEAITRPTFPAYRDSLLKALPEGSLLEIVGLFYADEKAPPGFTNMGLARAAKVKALLVPPLATERVVESSRMVATAPEGIQGKLFEAATFSFKKPVSNDTVEVIEVANTITILFPYGSSTREPDPRVDEYLGKLAERLKKTTETVMITGHTDSAGSEEFNMALGMARARHIQEILVKKGIKKTRISLESKGETEPVASNETEEGNRQNRRVVLVLHEN